MKKRVKAAKPRQDKASERLDFIRQLKAAGVVGYNEDAEGAWSVAFVPNEKSEQSLIGFSTKEDDGEDEIAESTMNTRVVGHPVALGVAAAARSHIFNNGTITGVAPEVVAAVEAEAAKFEFESGLADPKIAALARRVAAAKTPEERLHFQKLLDAARAADIAYAHN